MIFATFSIFNENNYRLFCPIAKRTARHDGDGRFGLCLLFLAVNGFHALFVVEDGLADAKALGRDLQQLVVGQEFQALLQAQLPGRHQAQSLIGAGIRIIFLICRNYIYRTIVFRMVSR